MPILGGRFQLTEIIFLIAVLPYLWKSKAKLNLPPSNLLPPLAAYLFINYASAIYSQQANAILEATGRAYLAGIFLLAHHWASKGQSMLLLRAWQYGAVASALIAIGGYVFALAGYPSQLVRLYQDYPYFGTIYRATGLTGSGGMLMSVCFLPTLLFFKDWLAHRRGNAAPLAILLFALGLSASKELILLGAGLLLIALHHIPRKDSAVTAYLKNLVWAAAALIYWTGTHLIVLPAAQYNATYLKGTSYTGYTTAARTGDFYWVETTYLELKKAAYTIATEHPILGVGPGQFNSELGALQAQDKYPAHLPLYDPHSTWFGAWAEIGFTGLSVLIFFIFILYRFTQKIPKETQLEISALLIFLGMALIESISRDMMNFRHIWLAFGILSGFILYPPKDDSS